MHTIKSRRTSVVLVLCNLTTWFTLNSVDVLKIVTSLDEQLLNLILWRLAAKGFHIVWQLDNKPPQHHQYWPSHPGIQTTLLSCVSLIGRVKLVGVPNIYQLLLTNLNTGRYTKFLVMVLTVNYLVHSLLIRDIHAIVHHAINVLPACP
jgi:hypothetical protein